MRARKPPELVKLLDYANNDVGVCTLLILAVVMLADEEDAPEEKTLLDRIATSSGLGDIVVEDIILLVRERDIPSIELACQSLRDGLGTESQQRLLELCIGMVTADGYVSISEQHILRFLADLFSVSPKQLGDMYRSVVGADLPPLGDSSSPDWWASQTNGHSNQREQREKSRRESSRRRRQSNSGSEVSPRDRRAYAILGLDPDASQSEVKEAYRQLAKVHHPDRFEQVGEEAVNAANERFRQIKWAYNHLT